MSFIQRNSCDACGGDDCKLVVSMPYSAPLLKSTLTERYKGKITEKDFIDSNYEVLECSICGFLFQKSIPDEELSNRLYSYEKTRIEQSLSKKRDANIDYYIRYATLAEKAAILLGKNSNNINLLDFGSGWGYFLEMAKAHGFNTFGVEISEERSSLSRKKGHQIAESIDELSAKEFDVIYSDQTFEHIPSPLKFLQKLSDRLSSNGIIYIHVPNCSKTKRKLRDSSNMIVADLYPLEHINGFNNTSLIKMAARANLKPISPTTILNKYLKHSHLTFNANFLQEGVKSFYTQNYSTEILFEKITK